MADVRTGPSAAADALAPAPDEAAPARWRLRRPTGPAAVVTVLAVLSAGVAVLLSVLLFPHLSINNDEPIYRLQAQALADGRLFPPAPDPADSYTPWLAVARDGHYVLKYTPVVPGIHAASLAVSGGFALGLAALAAAGVVVTYLLAREVLADRRVAALAAGLWAISPLVVVQSALLLPYLPFVVLVELTVLGAVRWSRTGRGRALVGAGFPLGLAVAARPYDAVMFLLPLAVWLAWTARRRLGGALLRLGAGLALPVLGLLAFDVAATGSPLSLPFALLEPDDKLGFGDRQLYPSDPPHDFGIAQGLSGVGEHLRLLGIGWVAGGALLLVLAVVAVARRRVAAPAALLGAGGLLLVVAYLGFWGAWNAADLWGGIRYVGPFYVLVLLVPLTILGARGLADLFAARRTGRLGGAVVSAVGVALVAVTLATALPANATMARHDDRLEDLLAAQGRALVFLPTTPAFLQHPSAVLDNGLRPDGRTVFALTRGSEDFTVVADQPGRSLLRLRVLGNYNQTPRTPYVVWLERLRAASGTSVPLTLTARPPVWASAFRVVLTVGDRRLSWPLSTTSVTAGELRVTPAGPDVVGSVPPVVETGPVPDDQLAPFVASAAPGSFTVSLLARGRTGREVVVEQDRLAYRADGTTVTVLGPDGLVARQGRGGDPALQLRLASPGG